MSRLTLVGISGTVITIATLHFFGILTPVETPIVRLISGGGDIVYSFREKVGGIIGNIRGSDREKALQCEQRLHALAKENAELSLAQSENETLRRELHFLRKTSLRSVSAHVVGFSTDSAQNSIVIDKGSRDGVREKRAVITDDGVLIGKTFNVSDRVSHVLLLTDNHSKLIGTILARKNATGVISGEYQIGLKMDLIPITEKITVDDLVVTAGIEDDIPSGLLVGVVSEIKTRPTDFYQTASIRPFINFSDIRIVSVVDVE